MGHDKTSYQPLNQHQGNQDCQHDDAEPLHLPQSKSSRSPGYICVLLLVVLIASNGLFLWRETHRGCSSDSAPYWGSNKAILKPFHWTSEYSNENKTESSPLWAQLFPIGDGLVTLEDEWSASKNLPASIKRYANSTQSIYFVAAYHQLHCLSIIRSVLYHLKEGLPLGVPFMHATHCLDSLRQSTMCHADDTLLYTENTHTYGDGQPRVCKDWDALERWTKEHRIYVPGIDDDKEV